MDNVRASYDTVAETYAVEVGDELAGKPLDRALLAALVELVGDRTLADVGCGPGHVTAHLAGLGANTIGLDLSPAMVATAGTKHPAIPFIQADLRELPAEDASWGGAVCLYTIIHLDADGRRVAFAELARVIRPGGWLLVSFHTHHLEQDVAPGGTIHMGQWWGHEVDVDFHFLDPAEVTAALGKAGFTIQARLDREPVSGTEAPTRRCYVLARRAPIP